MKIDDNFEASFTDLNKIWIEESIGKEAIVIPKNQVKEIQIFLKMPKTAKGWEKMNKIVLKDH